MMYLATITPVGDNGEPDHVHEMECAGRSIQEVMSRATDCLVQLEGLHNLTGYQLKIEALKGEWRNV